MLGGDHRVAILLTKINLKERQHVRVGLEDHCLDGKGTIPPCLAESSRSVTTEASIPQATGHVARGEDSAPMEEEVVALWCLKYPTSVVSHVADAQAQDSCPCLALRPARRSTSPRAPRHIAAKGTDDDARG